MPPNLVDMPVSRKPAAESWSKSVASSSVRRWRLCRSAAKRAARSRKPSSAGSVIIAGPFRTYACRSRGLTSAPASAAHHVRRHVRAPKLRSDHLAVHLKDDFAGNRVGDAKITAESSSISRLRSRVSIIFGRAATIASMLSHSPIRQKSRSPVWMMATPHAGEGVAVDGPMRLDIVLVPPRLHPHAHHVVGCHSFHPPQMHRPSMGLPSRQAQVPTSTCRAIRPALGRLHLCQGSRPRATHSNRTSGVAESFAGRTASAVRFNRFTGRSENISGKRLILTIVLA